MNEIYYLGGSPCSGKSTIAEMIVKQHGFQYFKMDDHLDEYMQNGAKAGHELYRKVNAMTLDELWLRDPLEQSNEEIAIYEIMLSYAMDAIKNLSVYGNVIAEGAGFLPRLMKNMNIDKTHYACIVPNREFQLKHFAQRTWVDHCLSTCSNKNLAFQNWMDRDAIFSAHIVNEAKELGYFTMVVDENQNITDNYFAVENAFCLPHKISNLGSC